MAAAPFVLATTDPFILTVVGALLGGGVLSAVVAFLRAKPQNQLDVVNAAKELYDRVEDDNVRLRTENDKLHSLLEDQHAINQRLLDQLAKLSP